MVGRTVLHYQFLEKLGAGGMGEIYKAQDTRLNRFVAIKVLIHAATAIRNAAAAIHPGSASRLRAESSSTSSPFTTSCPKATRNSW